MHCRTPMKQQCHRILLAAPSNLATQRQVYTGKRPVLWLRSARTTAYCVINPTTSPFATEWEGSKGSIRMRCCWVASCTREHTRVKRDYRRRRIATGPTERRVKAVRCRHGYFCCHKSHSIRRDCILVSTDVTPRTDAVSKIKRTEVSRLCSIAHSVAK
jgi:hypothetical protein